MRRYGLLSLCLWCALASCGVGGDSRADGENKTIGGAAIFVVESGPQDSNLPTVLFLHGASYNADVWVETGIMDALAEANIRSVAIDLPGFGSSASSPTSRPAFLIAAIEALGTGNGVVVVSPSMSGTFSLPLVAGGPTDGLRGVVLVAPVGIAEFLASTDSVDLPALVIWGDDDAVIPPGQAVSLASVFSESRSQTIPGAGHAAYEDEPELFTQGLIDFILDLA